MLWRTILAIKKQPFTLAMLKATFLPGLFFGLNLTFFFTGITKTRIANAEFIGTLAPLIIVPIAAWRLGERVQPRIITAGAAALSGVALILLRADRQVVGRHSWFGDLLCIGAVGTWSCYLFSTKSARRELDVGAFMTGMSTVATVTVFPFALSTHRIGQMSTKGWVLIGVMCVTSGLISHGLLAWSQKSVPISTLALMQLAQPGFAVIWAWLFLDERVNATQIVGMIIVVGAVSAIARTSARADGPTSPLTVTTTEVESAIDAEARV
jgi:drug/metabolite transporter (DMT)-like permease